jgi:hypothetical protein
MLAVTDNFFRSVKSVAYLTKPFSAKSLIEPLQKAAAGST